ncbi:MAG TPA: hypothetical protein VLF94_01890, partial [Chlamydiales bacterium]|nr:hypothetical protein [Chlamydiales bacterium]
YQYLRAKGCCGGSKCNSKKTEAVEQAHSTQQQQAAQRLEEAELRRARALNGAEPDLKNGTPFPDAKQ